MSDYDYFARLYDLEHCNYVEDIVLYQNFAQRCDGPVLDVGCGSGRVTLALARAGMTVVGVDNSAAMLARARENAAKVEVPGSVRFLLQDVCTLDLNSQFALAIFALNGFLHLLTAEDQAAALRSIHRALLSGGLLIVDVPNPHIVLTSDKDGQMVLRSRFQSPEGQAIWCFTNAQTDLADQVQHLTLIYDQVVSEGEAKDGLIHRTTAKTDLRFVYQFEMIGLLQRAGFKIDAVYGSYDLDPYQADSQVMLFVAYKPQDAGG